MHGVEGGQSLRAFLEVGGAEWRSRFLSCQHFGLCVVSPLPLAPGTLEILLLLQGRVGRADKVGLNIE